MQNKELELTIFKNGSVQINGVQYEPISAPLTRNLANKIRMQNKEIRKLTEHTAILEAYIIDIEKKTNNTIHKLHDEIMHYRNRLKRIKSFIRSILCKQ